MIKNGSERDDNEIRFVFAGNFYPNAYKYLKIFVEGIKKFKSKNSNEKFSLVFDFYGEINSEFKEITKQIEEVEYRGKKSLNEIHEVMSKADYALLFLTDDINYSISTKYCEYILHGLPIVVFGKFGFTMQFTEKNKLGWAGENVTDWVGILELIFKMKQEKRKLIIEKSTVSNFDLDNITDKLLKELDIGS